MSGQSLTERLRTLRARGHAIHPEVVSALRAVVHELNNGLASVQLEHWLTSRAASDSGAGPVVMEALATLGTVQAELRSTVSELDETVAELRRVAPTTGGGVS